MADNTTTAPANDWFNTIHNTLTPSQVYARDFIVEHPKCGIFIGMGGGKTLTTLAALSVIPDPGHILVVAPKNIADATWPDEIKEWNIPTPTVSLHITEPSFYKNGKPKKQRLLKPAEREAFYDEITPCTSDPNSPQPHIYITTLSNITELVERFQNNWPFDTIILDESQSFKNHTSQRTKALRKVSNRASRVVLLTGTPATESLEALWSQIYLLDRGQRLGKSLTAFRMRWFHPSKIIPGIGTVEWTPNPDAQEEIFSSVADITVHLENHDLRIPDAHHNTVWLDVDEDVHEVMDTLRKDQVIQAKALAEQLADEEGADFNNAQQRDYYMSKAVARTVGALRMKLLQCCAGSLIIEDLDKDDPVYAAATQVTTQPVHDIHSAKFDTVTNIVTAHKNGGYPTAQGTQTVPQSPVLIAYRFIAERDRLIHALHKAGINAVVFNGTPAMVAQWNNREFDAMLIHPASAGHGLNLQHGGNVMVWSTLPDSAEQYLQANARLHRPGQTQEVLIYEIMVRDTVDAKTLDALNAKEDTQKRLLDALTHEVLASADTEDITGDGGKEKELL